MAIPTVCFQRFCRSATVLLSINFLFLGKIFYQVSTYASPLSGLKIIIHLTQGFATLTLGFYVSALQAFCRFVAVNAADSVVQAHSRPSPLAPRPSLLAPFLIPLFVETSSINR